MADRPIGMLLAALFFAVLVLAACTTFATFVRLRRQRHMMRRIGPIVDMPPSPGLRTAGSEAEEGESRRARANGELAATAAAAAGDRNSRMAQAQARAAIELAAQIRIAELQMADEERALTHAIEASLSNRPDEEQTDGSTTVMQQALEVRRHLACSHHMHHLARAALTRLVCGLLRPRAGIHRHEHPGAADADMVAGARAVAG